MSYEATVEFKFNSTWTPTYGSSFDDDDFIPEEHFVITAPAADLNCRQYFKLFEKFMLAVGMSPDNIRSGAMSLVLNEWVNDADQRKTCDEHEVTRNEDLHEKFTEWQKRNEEIESIRHSRIENDIDPDRPFKVRPGVFVETVSTKESSTDSADGVA